MNTFADTLAEAVELLRGLPRTRDGVPAARRAVAAWCADRPQTKVQLVTDVRPGSPIVDYDLVLAHPDGGDVALTAPTGDGVPWTVDHSTHFASGRVLTIGDHEVLVQNALLTLRARAEGDPSIQEELIDHCLLEELIGQETEKPTQEEIQDASDGYRIRRGLLSRDEMMRWLENVGLTLEAYDNHITGLALRQRVRARVERETARDYLDRHPGEFDQVWAVWATGPEHELSAGLPHAQPAGGVEVTSAVRAARELPEPLRRAAAGKTVGPVPYGRHHLVGEIRERRPADPDDPATLAAAGRAGFAAFMAERRAAADIRWHWL
ncbi:hypothetical protein SMD20_47950 [Nonomuraea sp. LP-02]|uniref:hypothetical protein n=1 Tax=Nonomuraea sp. LP-02 TaxID=3097960 RepID=UPI002E3801C2|nr:hypothetical protein [Nonomuraea sp. LP-02]MED7932024.1 hypothetical protein [Nonomuraea sp. LP-02]